MKIKIYIYISVETIELNFLSVRDLIAGLLIRVGFYPDPDPTIKREKKPDPTLGKQLNRDPDLTYF